MSLLLMLALDPLPLQLQNVVQVILVLGLRQSHLGIFGLGLLFEAVQKSRIFLAKVDTQSV